jgi:hypothetical protein
MIVAQDVGNHGTISLKITRAVIAGYRWGMTASYYSITIVALGVLREPLPLPILLVPNAMPWSIPNMWCGGKHPLKIAAPTVLLLECPNDQIQMPFML